MLKSFKSSVGSAFLAMSTKERPLLSRSICVLVSCFGEVDHIVGCTFVAVWVDAMFRCVGRVVGGFAFVSILQ